ncbi:hypothetical protein M9H77_31188 [Catharanthus roseus]|uniref:Uncharacterized protein n=1 Tax=Catharanthus roseus TaxID=4058 RepID=A0ACC0A399_CATRO|nr:hypothetical protein M9H77_31188 [Catharanthus roseus]
MKKERGRKQGKFFYIEISIEKIIGKFLDQSIRMWRRTKTEWFRLLKTKRGCRLLIDFHAGARTSMKVPFQGRTTSRLLRYDLPSSSYKSYSLFIPIRCYDVPYSNSGDSRRSLALFTIAMIGAIVLTMHRTTKVERQDVFRRNAIDFRRTKMRRTTDPLTIY